MRNILIVGATRGLGRSLAEQYATAGKHVHCTSRYAATQTFSPNVHWISHVDIASEGAGRQLALKYQDTNIDLVIVCAGYFAKEPSLEELNWDKEVTMYKTVAIGPVFLIHDLIEANLLKKGSRVVLVGGESGSVALRHEMEVGGNYGGHGSKAALNMMGKLLSIDLKEKGVAVAIVHTGYLRKQNMDGSFETEHKNAVKPDEAATGLRAWIDTFDMEKTGQFWAVRGATDIKTAEVVFGRPVEDLPTPLQLPW